MKPAQDTQTGIASKIYKKEKANRLAGRDRIIAPTGLRGCRDCMRPTHSGCCAHEHERRPRPCYVKGLRNGRVGLLP